ncbi:hypothetical protein [Catenuloplanes indicus]|uniref:Uncharacterized protein n=1 Tax=Catenuloplanes indicus TaxID=137267 RepID=A0AAE4B234_9ACTN|nr:hypothetical protein [Catenuloplanes indicus]MDQ0368568.1 hypothetical protein [Catenuloplanes indicus]
MSAPPPSPYPHKVPALEIDPEWLEPLPEAKGMTVTDLTLRIAGGVLVVLAAIVTAILEVFYTPLRVGGFLIGASALGAVVANVALAWFALRAVGAKWAVALPALAWFVVLMVAAGSTSEGDILLVDTNWVGLATIFTGSMAFAGVAYRVILPPNRP